MTFLKLKNNAETTLAGEVSDSSTNILVTSAGVFPSEFPYILTIWRKTASLNPSADANMELVLVNGRINNTLSVTRGYGNTTAVAHASGEAIALLLTEQIFLDATYGIYQAIDSKVELSDLDTLIESNTEVSAAVESRHDHANQVQIDAIVDSGSGWVITDAERLKLEGIDEGANAYTLPIASGTDLGGLKIGSGLSISVDGVVTVTGTPAGDGGDMTKAVYDQNNNGKVDVAEAAESVPWSGVTNKPATFAPSSHASGHTSAGSDPLPNAVAGGASGLMTGADKTKLDGIEAGATADQTANEIMTLVQLVDGPGSGLEADLLDGQHGSYYEPAFGKNTAFNRNFGTAANTVCQGNDARLSNARTPTAHTHTEIEITDLKNYAVTGHTHTEVEITDLGNYVEEGDSRLTDARNPTTHTHVGADITDIGDYMGSGGLDDISDLKVEDLDETMLPSKNDFLIIQTESGKYMKVRIGALL